jgi:hypothetical protein
MNYNCFQFFNIPESINIDKSELEIKYIEKQNNSSANEDLKNQANRYYQILKNDLKRFEHFCELRNINSEYEIDQETLFKFYELNEEISEMNFNEKKLKLKELKSELNIIFQEISKIFEINNKKIFELYVKAKYINRILENS